MKPALIICPVGCDITYHPEYDPEDHWRRANPPEERLYDILTVVYNGQYRLQEGTSDFRLSVADHKWNIVKRVPGLFDISGYRYIAAVDDDLVTTREAFNYGIQLALDNDWALWQLSMVEGSGIIYDPLMQRKNWDWSETNFIEMGSPFFRADAFARILDFMGRLDFSVGWGIDKMFCDVIRSTANVVHAHSIYHPPFGIKPSYYDQSEAMAEMNRAIRYEYPHIMRHVYGMKDWVFKDREEKTIRYVEKK